MDAAEARDVVDLVEDRQREDLADAGDRAQAVKGVGVVALRLPLDRAFEVVDEAVVRLDEGQVDCDALAHARIRELFRHAVAVGRIGEAPRERRPGVLGARVLDARQDWPRLRTTWSRRRNRSRVDRIAAGST